MAWYDSCLLIVLWSISSQLQYLVSTTLMIPIHSGRNQHLKAALNSSENKIIHFLFKKFGGGGGRGVFQGCSRISQSIYVLLRQIIAWMFMSVGFCLTYRCSSIEYYKNEIWVGFSTRRSIPNPCKLIFPSNIIVVIGCQRFIGLPKVIIFCSPIWFNDRARKVLGCMGPNTFRHMVRDLMDVPLSQW